MRYFLILGTLLLASVATAVDFFPGMMAGRYSTKVQVAPVAVDANGTPTEMPTASVGIVLDSVVIACVSADPDAVVDIDYEIVPVGTRVGPAKAVAYSGLGCTGDVSEPSDDSAFFLFGAPNKPSFVVVP